MRGFTRQYLLEEIGRLREAWGYKSFWTPLKKSERAISGLFYVWVNTQDVKETDESLIQATFDEYQKRLAYILTRKNDER